MDIISNYMIIGYLNCLLQAVTSLRVSSGQHQQAAANFDVSPYRDSFLSLGARKVPLNGNTWQPTNHGKYYEQIQLVRH